jgi:hypothetical protein
MLLLVLEPLGVGILSVGNFEKLFVIIITCWYSAVSARIYNTYLYHIVVGGDVVLI